MNYIVIRVPTFNARLLSSALLLFSRAALAAGNFFAATSRDDREGKGDAWRDVIVNRTQALGK